MRCLLMITVSYCDINIVKNSLSSALYSKVLSINFIYLLKYSSLFLAHNAFVRTNRRTIAVMFFLPVYLSGMGVHCNHMVHFSVDLNLQLDSPMFCAPCHQSMSTYSQPSFSSST